MRAFVQLWDELTRERYGVTDPKQRRFRYGVQVNSLGLTEAQPENNVQRIVLEMLAVTLSKDARARAVQLPAWNEALGLPRPWDQQWSLRIQQVLAYESDLLEYDDLFEGSPSSRPRSPSSSRAPAPRSTGSRQMGGAVAAVECGYMKSELVASHARAPRPDRGRRGRRRRRQPLRDDRAQPAHRRPRDRDPGRGRRGRGRRRGRRPPLAGGARRATRSAEDARHRAGPAGRGRRHRRPT